MFRGQDAPSYRLDSRVLRGFVVVDMGCCLAMGVVLKRINEKLKRETMEQGKGGRDVDLYVL